MILAVYSIALSVVYAILAVACPDAARIGLLLFIVAIVIPATAHEWRDRHNRGGR